MSAERDGFRGRPEDYRPPSGIPARGYRWEDAKPGNTLALKHGAWSERPVAPLAARLVAEVVERNSYLQDAAYVSALQSVEHGGDLDGKGNVRLGPGSAFAATDFALYLTLHALFLVTPVDSR